MAHRLRLLLACAVLAYGALCLLAFCLQRKLLYFPTRSTEQEALRTAGRLGLSPWRDARGALAGWSARPEGAPLARLVVLHGNAGAALDRAHYASTFTRLGVEVLLLEYPGYGPRPGEPSLRSLSEAAAEALDALAARGREPIWLLGESLGSGVAARAVAARPAAVRGLVLVTPFARLAEVVRAHYPFLPSALLRDRFEPARDLRGYRGPAFVILAGEDEVVGIEEGRRLFEALAGPKRLVVRQGATHNGLGLDPRSPVWGEVLAFLSSAAPG